MGEWRCFSAETWAGDREGFLFRCDVPRRGDRWTFRVQASTLRALEPADSQASAGSGTPMRPKDPADAFEAWRSVIYRAALECIPVADPTVQQELSADALRRAQEATRPD
jgi:hypothetical protein